MEALTGLAEAVIFHEGNIRSPSTNDDEKISKSEAIIANVKTHVEVVFTSTALRTLQCPSAGRFASAYHNHISWNPDGFSPFGLSTAEWRKVTRHIFTFTDVKSCIPEERLTLCRPCDACGGESDIRWRLFAHKPDHIA